MARTPRAANGSRGRRVARALSLGGALTLGAALGLGLYVQRPSFRAALLAGLERRLEGSVRGHIELEGLARLGLSSARLERLEVRDERGVVVLALEQVTLRYGLLDLLGPWLPLAHPNPRIEHVRVERSRLRLASDPESGELTLLRALASPPGEPGAPPHASPPLVVSLPAIELGEVLVTHEDPALAALALRIERVHAEATLGGAGTSLTLQRFGLSASAHGQPWLNGAGWLSLASADGPLLLGFHGFLRGTELDARVELADGVLAAGLAVPHAAPAALQQIWPGWPLRAPLALELRGRGPLHAVALSGKASLEGASVDVGGSLDVSAAPRAVLELDGHALDARLVSESAPHTSLEARGTLELSGAAGGVLAQAKLRTDATQVDGIALPPVELTLRSQAGATSARAQLADARGRLELSAEIAPDATASIEVSAKRLSLAAIEPLGGARGELELSARARLAGGSLRGQVSGRASGLGTGALAVDAGTLGGSFSGTLAALDEMQLELTLDGSGVALGPVRLERARARVQGPWYLSRVEAELEARRARGRGSARLGLRAGARLDDLQLELDGDGLSLSAAASEWNLAQGRLRVERLALSGAAGALSATLELAPGRLALSANAERLDSARVCQALGVGQALDTGLGCVAGVWSGTASLAMRAGDTHGELRLDGENVRAAFASIAALRVQGSVAGSHVELALDGADPSLGELALRASGELAGEPLALASWSRATGHASVTLAQLPLGPLRAALAGDGPLRELDGRLDARVTLERNDPERLPDLFLQASSDPLRVRLAGAGATEAPLADYALRASASIEGQSGRGDASVRLEDAHGALLTASGVLALDLPALLGDPAHAWGSLLGAPLDALARWHPRSVSLLPPPLGARDLSGSVEATLQLRGSLAKPTLSLAAQAHDLLGSASDSARAVDVSGRLEYAPETGKVQGAADVVQAGQGLVVARLEGHLPPVFELPTRADEIELRAAALLNGVPLELWPLAARERLEARLYGSVELRQQQNEPGQQRAHLEILNLSAQGQRLGNGRLTLERGQAGLRGDLLLGTREHYLRASLSSAAGGAEGSAFRGSLVAEDFEAASLSPLTSGLLSRLGGAMDAELAFELRPRPKSDWYLGIDGTAQLRGGSAHVEELGLEVRAIDATVHARSTPDHTVLQIDPLSATARSRSPNLKGDAEIWLRGLRVESGEARLTLSDVPLSLKGVSRGIARGKLAARLERLPDHLDLEVKIPELRVRLPPSSTRALIEVDPNPELHVLQAAEPSERRDPDALRWTMRFDLGRNVRIQRGDLDLPLAGHPQLELQHEVRPSGTIEAAPGGRITLFNQSFSIDRGLIQLDPEAPDNPRVDVTASWRAADGTTIYVDVTGRAKDATVSTRDDRGLQDVERFYLITGGAPADGGLPSEGNAAEAAALGQTFSLGINELLRNSLGNVAVSIGTTSDDRASYSASVRLSDKLTFQGSFLPASVSNLQESTTDLTGTLDYRIGRSWSLRTELGTSGGAFDLLWSHRY
ncbi:MAG TPA: translocation/assembly module TamB domain-containing protein [Polyangiaceae bacterium]|nr:translocation/assembly module TamB domain-containing protein [Polyangiaceae bacterium]